MSCITALHKQYLLNYSNNTQTHLITFFNPSSIILVSRISEPNKQLQLSSLSPWLLLPWLLLPSLDNQWLWWMLVTQLRSLSQQTEMAKVYRSCVLCLEGKRCNLVYVWRSFLAIYVYAFGFVNRSNLNIN